jgi:hypothetical protein
MVLVVAAAGVVLARVGLGLANALGGEQSVYGWFTGQVNPESREILASVDLAPNHGFAARKAHV